QVIEEGITIVANRGIQAHSPVLRHEIGQPNASTELAIHVPPGGITPVAVVDGAEQIQRQFTFLEHCPAAGIIIKSLAPPVADIRPCSCAGDSRSRSQDHCCDSHPSFGVHEERCLVQDAAMLPWLGWRRNGVYTPPPK